MVFISNVPCDSDFPKAAEEKGLKRVRPLQPVETAPGVGAVEAQVDRVREWSRHTGVILGGGSSKS